MANRNTSSVSFAVNNTQMEHFVEHIENKLRTWPRLLWPMPFEDLRWESKQVEHASFFTAYASNDEVVLYIYQASSSPSEFTWYVANSNIPDLTRKTFALHVTRYQQDRVEVILTETGGPEMRNLMLTWIEQHWKGQYEILERNTPQQWQEPGWLPTEPPIAGHEGYTRSDVFDWYHRGGNLLITELRKLAPYLLIAESTVYNAHSEHKDLYPTGRKPDADSHFKGMSLPPIGKE